MEILSQDEINQLLAAINAMPSTKTKRPNKFSREQTEAIKNIHETFAYLATCSLSAHLRSVCHVHVSSVDELTYDEFIRAMPMPDTLATINMNPLKGNAILEIGPELTFAIIDRVCGGSGDGTKFQHDITDIEESIMENIIVHILGNLRSAWKQVLDIHPQVKTIYAYHQFARIVSPNEIVALVTLETKIGEAEGMINICFPYSTIGPVIEKISNLYWNKNPDNTPPNLSAAEEPSEEKNGHIPKESEIKNFRSFDYLNRVDAATLLNYINNEHPQVIALVLAHLEAGKASFIFQCFQNDRQCNVLKRIATMDSVKFEIASEIERILENKIIALSSDDKYYSMAGGVDSAVKILNMANQYLKEDIIDDLEKEDPELAEEIQRRAGLN